MAKGLIEHDTMTAIAEAIRSKNGETSGYTPADMPAAIGRISGGGEGYVFPADAFVFSHVEYLFRENNFYYLVNDFSDNFTFTGITALQHMFNGANKVVASIDFGHNNPISGNLNSTTYSRAFYNTHIKAIYNIPVPKGTSTGNSLINMCLYNFGLRHFTFDTNNGEPIVCSWKNQTLDMSIHIGYDAATTHPIYGTQYRITDAATYNQYKNHPNAWVGDAKSAYSFYNHDSAVETINSLPDASASGGTANTIKFEGSAGSATDGGAINTLTAEEIAAAAAKNWTVALV